MSTDAIFVDGYNNRSIPTATVLPVLHYPDVIAAAEWLCHAFGFRQRLRIGAHRIQMLAGNGAFVLADSASAPAGLIHGHAMMIRVRDADDHCLAARAAGARILVPPTSQPYGERQYSAADLIGRVWTFTQSERDVDPTSWGGAWLGDPE